MNELVYFSGPPWAKYDRVWCFGIRTKSRTNRTFVSVPPSQPISYSCIHSRKLSFSECNPGFEILIPLRPAVLAIGIGINLVLGPHRYPVPLNEGWNTARWLCKFHYITWPSGLLENIRVSRNTRTVVPPRGRNQHFRNHINMRPVFFASSANRGHRRLLKDSILVYDCLVTPL